MSPRTMSRETGIGAVPTGVARWSTVVPREVNHVGPKLKRFEEGRIVEEKLKERASARRYVERMTHFGAPVSTIKRGRIQCVGEVEMCAAETK